MSINTPKSIKEKLIASKEKQHNSKNNNVKFLTTSTESKFERLPSFNALDKSQSFNKNVIQKCTTPIKPTRPSTPSLIDNKLKSNSTTTLNQAFYTRPLHLTSNSNSRHAINCSNSKIKLKSPPNLPKISTNTPKSYNSSSAPSSKLQRYDNSTTQNQHPSTSTSISTPKSLHNKVHQNDLNATTTTGGKHNQNASTPIGNSEMSNLIVAVRVRPLNGKECNTPSISNIIQVSNATDVIASLGTTADQSAGVNHTFQYDYAFSSVNINNLNYADQQRVFESTANPLLDKAFEGYNGCMFAYGQTGSGKSYSMMGIDLDDNDIDRNSEAGIIPRFCQELFKRINECKNKIHIEVEVSYFEIYNEKIHDLLAVTHTISGSMVNSYRPAITTTSTTINPQQQQYQLQNNLQKRVALRVREHPIFGPYIVDLSVHPVNSHLALRNWLAVGNSQRATYATGMNDTSSRSHSIFNIILNLSDINQATGEIENQTKRSKISLVDLAGSERCNSNSGISNHNASYHLSTANKLSITSERLREGVSINKSLLTLGKVISALSEGRQRSTGNNSLIGGFGGSITPGSVTTPFVPYRESVLTWLLRENLGGNSRTVMLATISPANIHLDETLSTLRYACKARTIVNRVKVNENPHDRQIRELKAEVERLQTLHQEYERQKRYSLTNSILQQPRKIIIETTTSPSSQITPPKKSSNCIFSPSTFSIDDENEIEALRTQLNETEKELANAQRSWSDRLKEADKKYENEVKLLQQNGLALQLSVAQKQPCLVNLSADPMLSGTLLYILPEGKVKIGRSSQSKLKQPDIVLDGPLVAYNHCTIENIHNKLCIMPDDEEFDTYVNGELLTNRKQIYHMDRVIIGGSHYFRVSNPNCRKKSNNDKTKIVDYHLAHQEILNEQEKRLRSELEAEKKQALQCIESERLANEIKYTEKFAKLEFEKLKHKCNQEILEAEKIAFQKEYGDYYNNENDEHNNKVEMLVGDNESNWECNKENIIFQPYQSNIIEKIKRLMEHPSDESLHEIQLKVKEATRHCHDLGAHAIEFKQSQVCDEFGIFKAVVLVINRQTQMITEWPPVRLNVWLDIIRNTAINSKDIFNCVDCEWKELNGNDLITLNRGSDFLNLTTMKNDTSNQSLNNSMNNFNISVNLNSIKNVIRDKTNFNQTTRSPKHKIKAALRYDDDDDDNDDVQEVPAILHDFKNNTENDTVKFETQSMNYLKDLRRTIIKFKSLCNGEQANENQIDGNSVKLKKITQLLNALEQIESLSYDARQLLLSSSTDNLFVNQTPKTTKSVRFLVD